MSPCHDALRRLGGIAVVVTVALAPAFKAGRPAAPIARPVGHLLQAGRNEALERRLRWSRIRRESVPLADSQVWFGA